ncbi:Ankyrin-1 [Symbiodinium microadriaticum]|uniref:Ankyrin-1 n=1 Tax=Symbiodinium microadriaticum TaxID=2951 RepID=A0A1Q9EEM7_SYMMI|nr:Ankyrin-1 [Symbiodinium microadriaticum]
MNSAQLRLDPERFVSMGHSAGGHLAGFLAAAAADLGAEDDLRHVAESESSTVQGIIGYAGAFDGNRFMRDGHSENYLEWQEPSEKKVHREFLGNQCLEDAHAPASASRNKGTKRRDWLEAEMNFLKKAEQEKSGAADEQLPANPANKAADKDKAEDAKAAATNADMAQALRAVEADVRLLFLEGHYHQFQLNAPAADAIATFLSKFTELEGAIPMAGRRRLAGNGLEGPLFPNYYDDEDYSFSAFCGIVSGDGLIAIDVASFVETLPAEMHPVQALKEQLHSMCGLPRLRQRLICLDDEDVKLDEESTLRPGEAQAVLLNFCPASEKQVEELRNAARSGLTSVVEAILHRPQDPDLGNPAPLFEASKCSHLEVVRLLLEAKADKDKAANRGAVPLFVAARKGHLDVVWLLLESNADKDKATQDGATPLFAAAKHGRLEVVQALLESNVDKDKATEDGTTPVSVAAQNGQFFFFLRVLLESDADKDKATEDGFTPLYVAAQNGQLEVLRILLEFKADTDKEYQSGWTPLIAAAYSGLLQAVLLLLKSNADKDKTLEDGVTPLFLAAEEGHLEVVRIMLEFNADTDKAHQSGATPLCVAAQKGNLEVARLLLEADADKDKTLEDGATPLFLAAEEGHLEVVRIMLEFKADTDKAHQSGATPLCVAAQKGNLEVARLLLEADADKDKATEDGLTPLYVAAQNGQLEVLRILLEFKADTDKAYQSGSTPLIAAAYSGLLEAVLLLLKSNADKDKTLEDGATPLFLAAQEGHLEVARILLEFKVDTDKAHQSGATPLCIATQKGHLEVARLLLEANADKDKATEDGFTPLYFAARDGHLEVVRLLLEANADKDNLKVVRLLKEAKADPGGVLFDSQALAVGGNKLRLRPPLGSSDDAALAETPGWAEPVARPFRATSSPGLRSHNAWLQDGSPARGQHRGPPARDRELREARPSSADEEPGANPDAQMNLDLLQPREPGDVYPYLDDARWRPPPFFDDGGPQATQSRTLTGAFTHRVIRYRSNFVVVVTGELPCMYWLTTCSDLYICSCKYFAVSGRCEQEQCVHHILHTGDIDLTLVGQVAGRQPRDRHSKRGWSSAALYWSGQAADKEEKKQQDAKRRTTVFLPAAPCSLQHGELNAQHSDTAAARCERADAAHHTDTSTTASLQPDNAPAHPPREGGDSLEGHGAFGRHVAKSFEDFANWGDSLPTNEVWVGLRVERLTCLLTHLRKIKREGSAALEKAAAKLSRDEFQQLQAGLQLLTLKDEGLDKPSSAQQDLGKSEPGKSNDLEKSPRKKLKKHDSDDVSLNSFGLPRMFDSPEDSKKKPGKEEIREQGS